MTTNDTITDAMIRAGIEAMEADVPARLLATRVYRAMRAVEQEGIPMLHDIEPDTRKAAGPDTAALRDRIDRLADSITEEQRWINGRISALENEVRAQLEGHHLRLMGLERGARNLNQRLERLPDQIRAEGWTARRINGRIDELEGRTERLEDWTRSEIFARTAMDEPWHEADESSAPEDRSPVSPDIVYLACTEYYKADGVFLPGHHQMHAALVAAFDMAREREQEPEAGKPPKIKISEASVEAAWEAHVVSGRPYGLRSMRDALEAAVAVMEREREGES